MKYFKPEILIQSDDSVIREAIDAYDSNLQSVLESKSKRFHKIVKKLNSWHDATIKQITIHQADRSHTAIDIIIIDTDDVCWSLSIKKIVSFSISIPSAGDWFALSWGWCEYDEVIIDGNKANKLSILCGNLKTEIEVVFQSISLDRGVKGITRGDG